MFIIAEPINTFHSSYKTDNEPIRLSYHGNVHYNSVVDPRKATIGVGLGLPGLQPGVSDACRLRRVSVIDSIIITVAVTISWQKNPKNSGNYCGTIDYHSTQICCLKLVSLLTVNLNKVLH